MKLENLEGILEGKWEFEDEYSHFKVIEETIMLHGQRPYGTRKINDYEIVSNITQFKDFLKGTLKNKTYNKCKESP